MCTKLQVVVYLSNFYIFLQTNLRIMQLLFSNKHGQVNFEIFGNTTLQHYICSSYILCFERTIILYACSKPEIQSYFLILFLKAF